MNFNTAVISVVVHDCAVYEHTLSQCCVCIVYSAAANVTSTVLCDCGVGNFYPTVGTADSASLSVPVCAVSGRVT